MSYPTGPSTSRPQPSARAFLIRRVVAGLLIGLLLVALFQVISSALSSDPAAAPVAGPPSTVLVVSDGSPTTVTLPAATTSSTSTTSTSTTVPPPKVRTTPTAANPAVLYIAGDSDAGTFGPYLSKLLETTGVVAVKLDYKVSSGLARPDFYDWPAHFTETLPVVNPDIVVVTFGGNDAQGLTDGTGAFVVQQAKGTPGGDAEWRAEYAKRVGSVMDQLATNHRTLIWVGIPNDNNPDVTARLQVQDEVVKAEAAKRPGVVLIDTWARFSGVNSGYADFVIDPRDSVGKAVRAKDGFHLNTTGAEILALDIAAAVKADMVRYGAKL